MLTTTKTYDCLERLASISIAPSSAPQSPSSTYAYTYDVRNHPVTCGVDDLFAVTKHETPGTKHTYYATYDANGNVSEYLDANGAKVAHYEYSPFGRTTAATGAKAADFAHRFSTKYLDEHGLYYYGLRSYSAELGRWVNRDPIGEKGGANLCTFVGNSPLAQADFHGLIPTPLPAGICNLLATEDLLDILATIGDSDLPNCEQIGVVNLTYHDEDTEITPSSEGCGAIGRNMRLIDGVPHWDWTVCYLRSRWIRNTNITCRWLVRISYSPLDWDCANVTCPDDIEFPGEGGFRETESGGGHRMYCRTVTSSRRDWCEGYARSIPPEEMDPLPWPEPL